MTRPTFPIAVWAALAASSLACVAPLAHAADAAAQPVKLSSSGPPLSESIMAGDTLYVAGHIGADSAGKVPDDAEAEAHAVMDQIKQTVEKAGLTMDDLVSITVYCTDLDLFAKFNGVYRGYFHKGFPTRAFIGVNKLLAGAHFEVSGIAVRQPGPHLVR